MYQNKDILEIKNIQKQYFLLTWKMTGWCNYQCPYCINSSFRAKYSKWRSENEIIKIAERLNDLLEYNNVKLPIKLKLIGGEVTFYDLTKVLDKFKKVDKLIITSNFSNTLEYYKNLYLYCRLKNIELILILSKHPENLEFDSKVIDLTNWCNLNLLKAPQISFLITKDFNFSILDYYEKNKIYNIKLIVEKLPDKSMIKLTNDQLILLNKYINKYSKLKQPTYEVTFKDGHKEQFSNIYDFINQLDCGGFLRNNYFCNAGSNMITLNYDDTVWSNRCFQLQDSYLGSIWDNIKFQNENILCKVKESSNDIYCNLCSTISVKKALE